MNTVFHTEARELYQRCREMMQKCMIHAVGGKDACDVCDVTGRPPCAARETAIFLEQLYVEHGGDPLALTARITKTGRTKIVID